jgi:hypothetical protein
MGKWRTMIGVLAIAALLAIAAPRAAMAHEPDPESRNPDPEQFWRVMTSDDDASSSLCIGVPITALCAVETMIACFQRDDGDLCRIGMGLNDDPLYGNRAANPYRERYRRYRIHSIERYDAGNVLPKRTTEPWAENIFLKWVSSESRQYRQGDIDVAIISTACWPDNAACPAPPIFHRTTYHVRQVQGIWEVIEWWEH